MKDIRNTLLPLVLCLAAAHPAIAATDAAASASPVDAAETALLACHATYVQEHVASRYGLGLQFTGFTASEVALAAAADCRPAMDAYAQALRESATVILDEQVEARVRALREHAFGYTIDAMIKARDGARE